MLPILLFEVTSLLSDRMALAFMHCMKFSYRGHVQQQDVDKLPKLACNDMTCMLQASAHVLCHAEDVCTACRVSPCVGKYRGYIGLRV